MSHEFLAQCCIACICFQHMSDSKPTEYLATTAALIAIGTSSFINPAPLRCGRRTIAPCMQTPSPQPTTLLLSAAGVFYGVAARDSNGAELELLYLQLLELLLQELQPRFPQLQEIEPVVSQVDEAWSTARALMMLCDVEIPHLHLLTDSEAETARNTTKTMQNKRRSKMHKKMALLIPRRWVRSRAPSRSRAPDYKGRKWV